MLQEEGLAFPSILHLARTGMFSFLCNELLFSSVNGLFKLAFVTLCSDWFPKLSLEDDSVNLSVDLFKTRDSSPHAALISLLTDASELLTLKPSGCLMLPKRDYFPLLVSIDFPVHKYKSLI